MEQTSSTKQNGEANTESNSFNWKANELVLWMDNTQELYNIKQAWIKNYTNKIVKGKFELEKGIKGMDVLRKQIQTNYNKSIDEKMTISKEELRPILKALLESVISDITSNNYENESIKGKTAMILILMEQIQ